MEWSMNKISKLIACGAIAAFALVACGPQNGANAPAPSQQANLSSNVLQIATGAANIGGAANAGVNVVVTYRQPAGAQLPGGSATLVNSPTLTLPAAIPPGAGVVPAPAGPPPTFLEGFDPCSTVAFGSSPSETGTTSITSTSQTPGTSCAAAFTTFGQSGGAYGLGLEPYNAVGQGDYAASLLLFGPSADGTPFQVAPYPVPLYDHVVPDPNQMDAAWGGPPAIVATGSGGDSISGSGFYPAGSAGLPMGIDVFANVPAAAGAYKLSVSVPANTGTVTQSATYTLPAVHDLGTAGAAPAFVYDGHGGGTVTLLPFPATSTEAIVEVTDFGAGPGPTANLWYTMVARNGAAGVGCTAGGVCTLPDAIGPGGGPSIAAAGDQVVTQVIYVDYPLYELQYGTQAGSSNGVTAPTLLGAVGSADLSISTRTCTLAGGANCNANLPLLHMRSRTTQTLLRHK